MMMNAFRGGGGAFVFLQSFSILLLLLWHSPRPGKGCNARFFTRFLEHDTTLTMLVGGRKQFNQTHYIGSDLVEVIGVNGSCRRHKVSLPYTLCDHRAVFISLEEEILVCGGFHNRTCGPSISGGIEEDSEEEDEGGGGHHHGGGGGGHEGHHEEEEEDEGEMSSRKCLVWRKGEKSFHELTKRASKLPAHPHESRAGSLPAFDLQHVPRDVLFYRPWGGEHFWKGFIDLEDKLVWEERSEAPLPTARGCSLIFKGRFVMIGGEWADQSGKVRMTDMMLRYLELKDGREVGWQLLGRLPEPLVDIECLAYGDGIVVAGGKRREIDPVPESTARKVRFWSEKTGKWNGGETKVESMGEVRVHPAVAVMRGLGGIEKLVAFGGYDDVRTPRFPRFLATAERYSAVLHEWQWPEFGLDEAKSGMAVVTVPSSWIPECEDPHFFDAAQFKAPRREILLLATCLTLLVGRLVG